jgi:hypothetical protein
MHAEVHRRIPRAALGAALETVLAEYFEASLEVRRWRRRLSRYSSSSPIETLQVELAPDKLLRLVLKDLSPGSQLATARRVRPHFLYHPLREIETYRTTLRQTELGTAACYGVYHEPDRGCYWLFLERVEGPLLWQVGRGEHWNNAARWLARLHSAFDPALGSNGASRLAHLRRHDEHYFALWPVRAEAFLRQQRCAADSQWRRRFIALLNRYDRVVQRLVQLPTTLVHGEFYPSNVILRKTGSGRAICPIDWELAAVAPGMIDLAALTSGAWSESERMTMISAYRESRDARLGSGPSVAELTESVDLCRLHLAVQWLGWAPDWSPPELHAQNWLREAVHLAAKLGL